MSIETATTSLVPARLSHAKFKMALKSKEVQRQYPNAYWIAIFLITYSSIRHELICMWF